MVKLAKRSLSLLLCLAMMLTLFGVCEFSLTSAADYYNYSSSNWNPMHVINVSSTEDRQLSYARLDFCSDGSGTPRADLQNVSISATDYFHYDVYFSGATDGENCSAGLDLHVGGHNYFRDDQPNGDFIKDDTGRRLHPENWDESVAVGKWYHRRFQLHYDCSGDLYGILGMKIAVGVQVYFANLCITDQYGGVKYTLYDGTTDYVHFSDYAGKGTSIMNRNVSGAGGGNTTNNSPDGRGITNVTVNNNEKMYRDGSTLFGPYDDNYQAGWYCAVFKTNSNEALDGSDYRISYASYVDQPHDQKTHLHGQFSGGIAGNENSFAVYFYLPYLAYQVECCVAGKGDKVISRQILRIDTKPVALYDQDGSTSIGKGDLYFANDGVQQLFSDEKCSSKDASSKLPDSRVGYTFQGYYTDPSDGIQIVNADGTIIQNYVADKLYAHWSNNVYSITYDYNGGSAGTGTIYTSVGFGYPFNVPIPTKAGHTFAGWYISGMTTDCDHHYSPHDASYTDTDRNETHQCRPTDTDFLNLNSSSGTVTFKAMWTVNQYTVTCNDYLIDTSGNKVGNSMKTYTKSVDYGTTVSGSSFDLTTYPARDQYVIYHSSSASTTVTGEGVVVERYFGCSINISIYDLDGKTEGESVGTFKLSYDGGASWKTTSYEDLDHPCLINSTVKVKDISFKNSQYEVKEVQGAVYDSATGIYTLTVTADGGGVLLIYSKYKDYNITVIANDNNYGTVSGSGSYAYNSSADISATPKTGYHFVKWDDNDTNASRTVTVTGAKTYTAIFAPNQYRITVVSDNATMGTVSGTGDYDYGSQQTITATANTGYHFVEWNDGDTNASRTITVTGNATYTAYFEVETYTVSYKDINSETFTGTFRGEYPTQYTFGVGATLSDNVYLLGFVFKGWFTDKACKGVVVTEITTSDYGNKVFYAKWVRLVDDVAVFDHSEAMEKARNEYDQRIQEVVKDTSLNDDEKQALIDEIVEEMHQKLGMLNAAFQLAAGVTEETDPINIRFLSTVDWDYKYGSAGFKVTFISTKGGEKTLNLESRYCYPEITTGVSGIDVNYTPDYFDENSNYFITATMTGIPNTWMDYTIKIQSFVRLVNTKTYVYGIEKTYTIRDLIKASANV